MTEEILDQEYINELEKHWRYTALPISDKLLMETFPEAREAIFQKLDEYSKIKKMLVCSIKDKLRIINKKSKPENQWFWKMVVMTFDGDELTKIEKYIARLNRQLSVGENRLPNNSITDEQIKRASNAPIDRVVAQYVKLKQFGNTFSGLCPFHKEKHASFYVYPKTNSWYCFGCQKSGDPINFVQEINGLTFRQAVEALAQAY